MAFDTVVDKAKLEGAITASANAIREKTGDSALIEWKPGNGFADEISGIQANPVIQPLSVTANGTYEAPDGVDGYNPVTVNVAASGGSDDSSFKDVIERTAVNPTLPSDLTSIGPYAFHGCIKLALTSLPDGMTSIGTYAFHGCIKLALTSLPDGVTTIENYAFYNCASLALTSLPDGITNIKPSSFQKCTSLALTELPSGITNIYGNAFSGCTSLTEITFKGTPNKIYGSAFEYCTNLLTINVPWAEGEVANAPWGATNATINYNYVEEG